MSRLHTLLPLALLAIVLTGCVGPHGRCLVGHGGCDSLCDAQPGCTSCADGKACLGCGDLYVDPWINEPADCQDPCDQCGNYNGQSCGKCRGVFSGVCGLWGIYCGHCKTPNIHASDRRFSGPCGGCFSGCHECRPEPACGCDGPCSCDGLGAPVCGIEPVCGCEGACSCGVEPLCGTEPICGLEPVCGCEGPCGCGAEPVCGLEPVCGCEGGCSCGSPSLVPSTTLPPSPVPSVPMQSAPPAPSALPSPQPVPSSSSSRMFTPRSNTTYSAQRRSYQPRGGLLESLQR